MTAAAIPFARSGYEVIVDFSIPPQFLETARKILRDAPLNYIVLLPSPAVCVARAAACSEGKIADYDGYREFYALFEDESPYLMCDDDADAYSVAKRIRQGLDEGIFVVA